MDFPCKSVEPINFQPNYRCLSAALLKVKNFLWLKKRKPHELAKSCSVLTSLHKMPQSTYGTPEVLSSLSPRHAPREHRHLLHYLHLHLAVVVKTNGIPFWGRCTTQVYFRGDWDVHWAFGILTHGHLK